jgi:hypothetical protein
VSAVTFLRFTDPYLRLQQDIEWGKERHTHISANRFNLAGQMSDAFVLLSAGDWRRANHKRG